MACILCEQNIGIRNGGFVSALISVFLGKKFPCSQQIYTCKLNSEQTHTLQQQTEEQGYMHVSPKTFTYFHS